VNVLLRGPFFVDSNFRTANLVDLLIGEHVAIDPMGIIESGIASALAVFAWFALNFLGRPILSLREKRLEAIQVAERYSNVGFTSSDELRTAALKSLHDVGNALRAYSREASIATRLWRRLMKYDLDIAAHCLFGPKGRGENTG
jgi:hypothetical protein